MAPFKRWLEADAFLTGLHSLLMVVVPPIAVNIQALDVAVASHPTWLRANRGIIQYLPTAMWAVTCRNKNRFVAGKASFAMRANQ
jgi:hypothetical protein